MNHNMSQKEKEMHFLRVAQVAKMLCLSRGSVYKLIERRDIQAQQFHGALRVSYAELERYLERTKLEIPTYTRRAI